MEQEAFQLEVESDITNLRGGGRGGGRSSSRGRGRGRGGGGDIRMAGFFLGPIMVAVAISMAWFNE